MQSQQSQQPEQERPASETSAVIRPASQSLAWRSLGPHRGGRVVAVAGDPRNPAVFYFGACAGGVWKTLDGGTTWRNVSDGYFDTAAVGALAVAPSDPNVIYAGTGEATIRGNVSHGDGVYKSTDGGKSWKNVGLRDTRHIADIVVDPQNPDVVYVAALGHAFGPNEERGVFRSRDGGQRWERVLYRSPDAGAVDLAIDPTNPRILYAALYQVRRTFWSLTSGGPECGLYRSSDGGDSWQEITRNEGLPTGVVGKIGVAVAPSKPGRVYALVEAEDGAVFRSDDGGQSWERGSEQGGLRWRAWYYMHIFADPQDADTVWVLNGSCYKSIDAGKSFTAVPTPHGDNHGLWIDPSNPQRMIEGNDGGACVSYNGGYSWSTLFNQPTAQFYHVTTDSRIPYRLYGSQQDNTAISIPSMSVNGAITETEWFEPGGGESGYIAVRPDNPDIVFAGAIGSGEGNGRLLRYDHRTGHVRNITIWPVTQGMGEGAASLKYRFQWTFPILLSPHDPNILYVTSNHVHRSTDEGMSWETISPDLTRNDPEKQQPSGGPITKDNTGAEVYDTIFAFVESPHAQGEFWAGSDDGLVHLSRDGGQDWQDITPRDLPAWSLVSVIELSPHQPGAAYLAATRYKHDEYGPMLFKTTDYGESWTRIDDGLPGDAITRVVREDPGRRGLLYCGTETGVFLSFDDGDHWQPLQLNLPVCPIHDLMVQGSDLLAATHGRSFWILDDVSPLRQLADSPSAGGLRLFTPRDTVRFIVYEGYGMSSKTEVSYRMAGPVNVDYLKRELPTGITHEDFLDAGKNPPDGVVVSYNLPEGLEGELTLTVFDSQGNEVRRFSSEKPKRAGSGEETDDDAVPSARERGLIEGGQEPEGEDKPEPRLPKEVGLNRFVWDMRYAPPAKVPGDKSTEYYQQGPRAVPGDYELRLSLGDQTQRATFKLLKDPRVSATEHDLRQQFDLLLKIRDKLSETNEAINTIREVERQLMAWERRGGENGDTAEIGAAAKRLRRQLDAIEAELIQPKADDPRQFPEKLNAKLAALCSFVDMDDARPTKQAREAYDELAGKIDHQLAQLRSLLEQELPQFESLLRRGAVPTIAVRGRKAGS